MTKETCVKEINKLLEEYKQYPQGLKTFGIEGRRDSDMRMDMYKLTDFVDPDSQVLDIGSNCGFLDVLLAPHVDKLVGVEIDETMIKVSRLAADALGLTNCFFINADFRYQDEMRKYIHDRKFDLVISCQMHHWVKLPFASYVAYLLHYTRPGGHLLMESHNLNTIDSNWSTKVETLNNAGFQTLRVGSWAENPGPYWIPPKVGEPLIPRQFVIFRRN